MPNTLAYYVTELIYGRKLFLMQDPEACNMQAVINVLEKRALKNVHNCWNTNIFSYLETSGRKSYDLLFNFSTTVLIRHLWQH